jgi:hypothetical protein
MIVEVTAEGAGVRDADDCGRLSVATGLAGADLDAALEASGIGARAGQDVLLDVAVLRDRARAAASAPDWDSRWSSMLDYATRKGWVTPDGAAVRAHIERAG